MAIRKHILSTLNKTGLNFDNGYGYTDDKTYYAVRSSTTQNSDIMKAHAYILRKYANIVADELGINKAKAYITMYGHDDYIVLSNSRYSYIKITLCSDGVVSIFMGDENILRPKELVRKSYKTRDEYIKFGNGEMKTISDLLSDEKVVEVVNGFNKGRFL